MRHLNFLALAGLLALGAGPGCKKPAEPAASAEAAPEPASVEPAHPPARTGSPPAVTEMPDVAAMVDAAPAQPISLERVEMTPESGALVLLLDPGPGDRQALRFSPPPGVEQIARMSMGMSMTMDLGGMVLPVTTPPMAFDMAIAVDSVAPDGVLTYSARVTGVEVEDHPDALPGLADQLRAELQGMVGLSGQVVITPTGRTLEARFEPPAGASAEIAQYAASAEQSASSLCSPLPDEPVAPGAQWVVLSRTEHNGLEIVQQQTVDYVARDGELITLQTEIVQAYAGSEISLPDMPPGAEVELIRFEGGGSGVTTMRLDSLIPDDSRGASAVDVTMKVAAEGMVQQIRTTIDMTLDMERR